MSKQKIGDTELATGRIYEYVTYEPECGGCGMAFNAGTDPNAIRSKLREAGWVDTLRQGWVCPHCLFTGSNAR
jgi:hypothetical protein